MKLECTIVLFNLYFFETGEISGLRLLNKLPVCIDLIAVLCCLMGQCTEPMGFLLSFFDFFFFSHSLQNGALAEL